MLELFQCPKMIEGMNILGWSPVNEVAAVLPALVAAAGGLFLFNLFFRWLWNVIMPGVFGLRRINFWQAFGLMIISGLLFGGHDR